MGVVESGRAIEEDNQVASSCLVATTRASCCIEAAEEIVIINMVACKVQVAMVAEPSATPASLAAAVAWAAAASVAGLGIAKVVASSAWELALLLGSLEVDQRSTVVVE